MNKSRGLLSIVLFVKNCYQTQVVLRDTFGWHIVIEIFCKDQLLWIVGVYVANERILLLQT